MNLYEIIFEHFAPKDSKQGIFTYLIAESDKQVYEWLASNPTLKDGRWIITSWKDYEKDEEIHEIYDENYNVIGEESFKQRMIRLNGEINDEEVELNDLYYGKTLYGWKLIKENITKLEIKLLNDTGISLESV